MRVWVFGLLALAGVVLPYAQFVPWMREHGVDVVGFFAELRSNRVGVFFAWDLAVSALALGAAAVMERERLGAMRLTAVLIATFCVGVSLGLPLFFLFWLGGGDGESDDRSAGHPVHLGGPIRVDGSSEMGSA